VLPYFLRHYEGIVDRFFVYDGGSTIDSLSLLNSHPKVEVRYLRTAGDSFIDAARRFIDTAWRKSRGSADWVIVADIDEFVFHPNLRAYLSLSIDAGVTALRGVGFEMVAEEFPSSPSPLTDTMTRGARSAGLDKLCAFTPDAIAETNFSPGRHQASPTGHVVWPAQREILLLRYHYLGVPYVIERSERMKELLRDGDLKNGWGSQHLWSAERIAEEWNQLYTASGPVPGLGELSHLEPADYDEEALVAATGLLDGAWYLERYPDVAAAGVEPIAHFCAHGWKEHRQPNAYFEPDWYLANHAPARLAGGNPLIHYARYGESAGARPSPRFDPDDYRRRYGLAEGESPLRHYLSQRASEADAAISDSELIQYGRDDSRPLLEPRGREEPDQIPAGRDDVMPSYREITEVLGFDLVAASNPVSLDPRVLLQVLDRFIRQTDVDEDGYRRAYPDVAQAIERGEILSARDHYLEFGYFEGRDPTPPAAE
jgi:hypothetical protein